MPAPGIVGHENHRARRGAEPFREGQVGGHGLSALEAVRLPRRLKRALDDREGRRVRFDAIEPHLHERLTHGQRHLFEQIKAGLKPGGIFVYEQWHPYGWVTRRPPPSRRAQAPRIGGSKVFQYSDIRLEELARIFADYQIVLYREAVVDQSVDFGSRRGVMLTEVSSLIAKKPF